MRADNAEFAAYNTAASKRPRVVVRVSFDAANTDFLYFTSHADCDLPSGAVSSGIAIQNVVRSISGQTQKINPDQANSTIGGFSFSLIDKASAVTTYLQTKHIALKSLRYKQVVVYIGYQGMLWADYITALTYIIDKASYINGEYKFTCSDIQRAVRQQIFTPVVTYLSKSVTANQGHIPVLATSTSFFSAVLHDSSYTVHPSLEVFYVKVEDELIACESMFTHGTDGVSCKVLAEYTGTHTGSNNVAVLSVSGTPFVANALIGLMIKNTTDGSTATITANTTSTVTGTLSGGTQNDWDTSDAYEIYTGRGVLNSKAVEHVMDSGAATERRLKIEEHIFIEGPAPKVAYALHTGYVAQNLFTYSQDFTNAVWTDPSAQWTVTANTDVAPDGTTTADEISVTGAGNALIRFVPSPTIAGGSTYTVSVWAKLKSGTVTSLNIDLGNTTAESFTLSSQWQRITMSAASHATNNYVDFEIIGASAGADVLLWGAQLTATTYLTPYYATTATARSSKTLPAGWHLGIDHNYVEALDYTGIGPDFYNQFDDTGRHVRFEAPKKTDGKKFIETELLLWMGAFMPVYSNGRLGLRRLSPVLSNSGYLVALNRSNIVDYSELTHDYGAVINQITVDWNYVFLKGDYTKTTVLIDADSIAMHGDAPVKNLKLKGVHTGSHTDEDLASYFDTMRDRYSGQPLRVNLTVMPSLNTLEVGDTVRVTLDEIRDYTNADATTLDRVFEIQQVDYDWFTGDVKLNLFGSSMKAGTLVRTAETSVLDDAFYNSAGTELSTVLTIAAGAVTANGSLTGGQTLAEGIYYYLGNLTINAGVTVTISNNVQLRIRGHLTINGTMDGAGNGLAGGAGATLWSNGLTTITSATPPRHNAGFGVRGGLGITAPTRSLARYATSPDIISAFSSYIIRGEPAVPFYALRNADTSLIGLPTDLRGSSGTGGDAHYTTVPSAGSWLHTIITTGTAGAAGGAGLMCISRGFSFGVVGSINLSGDDAARNSATYVYQNLTHHGMAGGGGAPGGFALFLDGNHTPPELAGAELVQNYGDCPWDGDYNRSGWYVQDLHVYGYPGIDAYDMGDSGYTLQYIPEYNTAAEELPPPPPNVTGLTATNDGLHALLTWNGLVHNRVVKYRIKSGTTWASGTFLADIDGTSYRRLMSTIATYDFMIVAVDGETGSESATVATASLSGMPVVSIDSNVIGADDYLSSTFFYHNRFDSLDGYSSSGATLNTDGSVTIGGVSSANLTKAFTNSIPPFLWTNVWRFKCIFSIPSGEGTNLNNSSGSGLLIGVGDYAYAFFGLNLHWVTTSSRIRIQARTTNDPSVTTSVLVDIADTGLLIEAECILTPGVNMVTTVTVSGTTYTATITTNLPTQVPFELTVPKAMQITYLGNKALSTSTFFDYFVSQDD